MRYLSTTVFYGDYEYIFFVFIGFIFAEIDGPQIHTKKG